MDQPVIIKFKWTAEDLLQAHRYHFRHICRPVFRFGLHFIAAMALLAGALHFFSGSDRSLIMPIFFMIGGVYWFAIWPFERRWMVRRQYARQPGKDMDCEWEIGPDKITFRSRLGHSEFGWEAFVKVVRTPSGMMFYTMEQLYHWLPRRGFDSDADFERLSELAKAKVPRFYHVA